MDNWIYDRIIEVFQTNGLDCAKKKYEFYLSKTILSKHIDSVTSKLKKHGFHDIIKEE